jgi:predicted Mrr-cat superfamily restriction endonuclease
MSEIWFVRAGRDSVFAEDFIQLDYYEKLDEEVKSLVPLRRVYVLAN